VNLNKADGGNQSSRIKLVEKFLSENENPTFCKWKSDEKSGEPRPVYRYRLTAVFPTANYTPTKWFLMVVGCNPYKADKDVDDPAILNTTILKFGIAKLN